DGTVMASVERIRPGQYIWVPEIAPAGPMLVVVNIATQRVVAYRNGVPIAVSTISTGKPGHRTPTGVFT
ncbi:L,D-transpeptidase family protein, partial [Enterobacter hormaechei]|uniref:L,D-transpeptidase family protein n=1 Tax=Enterobacter hormaechei TaxID=158836 RepID=UPI001953CF01